MKKGTIIKGQFIVDKKTFKNCLNLETALSVLRSSLSTSLYNEGLEIYNFGDIRAIDWSCTKEDDQLNHKIRQFSGNCIEAPEFQLASNPKLRLLIF